MATQETPDAGNDPLDSMSDDDLIAHFGLDDDDEDDAGSPEAPDDDGEAPAAVADEADEPDDADHPRDERGRFVARKPEAEDQGEPLAPSDAPAAEPTDSAAQAEPDEANPPATYVADGQPIEIERSESGPDGVFIPADTWQDRIQPLLSAGHFYHHNWRQVHGQSERSVNEAKARAEAAEQNIDRLYDMIDQLVQDPEKFDEFRDNAVQNWAVWKANAQAAAATHRLEARDKFEERVQQEREEAEQGPREEGYVRSIVQQRTGDGQRHAALDPQRAFRVLNRARDRVLVRADTDDPAGRWRKGDRLVDWRFVDEVLDDELQFVNSARQQAVKAAETTGRRVGHRVRRHPPTVTGGRQPGAESALPTPKTREEADRLLDRTVLGVGGRIN